MTVITVLQYLISREISLDSDRVRVHLYTNNYESVKCKYHYYFDPLRSKFSHSK